MRIFPIRTPSNTCLPGRGQGGSEQQQDVRREGRGQRAELWGALLRDRNPSWLDSAHGFRVSRVSE